MAAERILPPVGLDLRRIQTVIKNEYPDLMEHFKVRVIPNAGLRLESLKFPPKREADEIFSDVDGTLINTDGISKARLLKYKEYVLGKGIPVTEEAVQKIFEGTYAFCRWDEVPEEGKIWSGIVHAKAQMAALHWATEQLNGVPAESIGAKAEEITNTLQRITGQLNGKGIPEESDPFYFRQEDRRLQMRSMRPWSKEIEEIFVTTQREVSYHQEVMDALFKLGGRSDINLGLFTLGDDEDQVRKTLDIIKNNSELPISHIWITKVKKGRFIEAIEQEEEKSSMNYPGRVRVILDDNPEDLQAIVAANERKYRNEYTVVRSLRPNSKYGKDVSQITLPEIYFDPDRDIPESYVASRLLAVRDEARERRFGGVVVPAQRAAA